MVIYYCITILANIAAIPIFYEYINISALNCSAILDCIDDLPSTTLQE